MSELTPQNAEQMVATGQANIGEEAGTQGSVSDTQLTIDEGALGQVSKQAQRPISLAELPSYARSLLKIAVPVRVVLAEKKESVQDVVELAPGTIIKFSKSCEETLHLFVGDQQVAEGEAVKVGDKFGFRVTQMTLPDEHFLKLRPKQAS